MTYCLLIIAHGAAGGPSEHRRALALAASEGEEVSSFSCTGAGDWHPSSQGLQN